MNINELVVLLAEARESGQTPNTMYVSPKTYADLTASLDVSAASGLWAFGIDVRASALVPDDQALLWDTSQTGIPLPPWPSTKPVTPYDNVRVITQVGPNRWEARDDTGRLLLELTDEGARKLAASRGLPLNC